MYRSIILPICWILHVAKSREGVFIAEPGGPEAQMATISGTCELVRIARHIHIALDYVDSARKILATKSDIS